jgi:hypothetical protein
METLLHVPAPLISDLEWDERRGGGAEMVNKVVAEPGNMREVARGGEGIVVAPGGGLAPVVTSAPYVELVLGVIEDRQRRGLLEYRGWGQRGTSDGWREGGVWSQRGWSCLRRRCAELAGTRKKLTVVTRMWRVRKEKPSELTMKKRMTWGARDEEERHGSRFTLRQY